MVDEPPRAPEDQAPPPQRQAGQRHIPVARRLLVAALTEHLEANAGAEVARGFVAVAELATALVHHQFHARLEHLKECFAPFDPDDETRRGPSEERSRAQRDLVAGLAELMDDANFEPVDRAELDRALAEETLLQVRVQVGFEDFEEVLFYARGAEDRTEEVVAWGGLRRRLVRFTSYERVLIYAKVHEADHFSPERLEELPFEPGSTFIKLFKDVPRADLETLFPNTEVRMRPVDHVLIGVPAVVGGLAILFTKLLTSLGLVALVLAAWLGLRAEEPRISQGELVALGVGLLSFGGFLWRQVSKFRNRRLAFLQRLSEHLYFKNLDNGAGVLHHLVDVAEEEETKELLVAYAMLLVAGAPLEVAGIDAAAESWFARCFGTDIDFEEDDAVAKLVAFELAEGGDPAYTAVPPAEAYRRLDRRWDDTFVAP